jgi:hypothetical protein
MNAKRVEMEAVQGGGDPEGLVSLVYLHDMNAKRAEMEAVQVAGDPEGLWVQFSLV